MHPVAPAQLHGSGRSLARSCQGSSSSYEPLPGPQRLMEAEGRPRNPLAFGIVLIYPGYTNEHGTVVLGSVKGTALHIFCSKPHQIMQNLSLSSWRRGRDERSQPGTRANHTDRSATISDGF